MTTEAAKHYKLFAHSVSLDVAQSKAISDFNDRWSSRPSLSFNYVTSCSHGIR